MQVSVQVTHGLERRMSVSIPAADVQNEVDRRIHDYAQRVRIDGFRPGKVPVKLVRKRYGLQLRQETLGDLVEEHYRGALQQEGLVPADYTGQPMLEIRQHAARTQHDLGILLRRLLNRLAIQVTGIIGGNLIALHGGALHRIPAGTLPAQCVEHLIDIGIGDITDDAFDLNLGEIGDLNVGIHLKHRIENKSPSSPFSPANLGSIFGCPAGTNPSCCNAPR